MASMLFPSTCKLTIWSSIGGVNVVRVALPREERPLRRELDEFITAKNSCFQTVLDDDLDQIIKEDAGYGCGIRRGG